MIGVGWDIESNDLLENAIDYSTVPYKLKDDFVIHCIVCTDKDTGEEYPFVQDEVFTKFPKFVEKVDHFISHNGINFDHLVIKLYLGMDYEVDEQDTFMGRKVIIDDTMVMSKALNADRVGGHSLDSFGKRLKFPKMDWRAEAMKLGLIKYNDPKGAEFATYHPRMLDYCKQDVAVTLRAYKMLKEEWGDWDFESAYKLEKKIAEIITRQEHRGFFFDEELAKNNLVELDALLLEATKKVEPYIPEKVPTKAAQKPFTPPKLQQKKNLELTVSMEKFVERMGMDVLEDEDGLIDTVVYKGVKYPLPMDSTKSLLGMVKATIDDSTHIKEWLVKQGWQPSEYSEKDITCNTKKVKLTQEKFEIAVKKYVQQTLASPFCKDRLEWLKMSGATLESRMLKHGTKRPLKVLINPKLTIGQEKEICPNLIRLGETFPYAKDLAEVAYLVVARSTMKLTMQIKGTSVTYELMAVYRHQQILAGAILPE